MTFLIAIVTYDFTGVIFFPQILFKNVNSIVASGRSFFSLHGVVPAALSGPFFLSFLPYFKSSTALVCGKAVFGFLALDSSGRGSLTVVSWVCIFEAIFLEEQ